MICILLLFAFLLFNPIEACNAASSGLMLWFETLIPVLLPFFIISNMLLALDGISAVTSFVYPLFRRLFGCSREGCFVIISGFLCGFPVGAKIIGDLVRNKQISIKEGNYLLCFCNNVSPAFLIGYCLNQSLQQPQWVPVSLLILYGTPLILAILVRHCKKFTTDDFLLPNAQKNEKKTSGFQISFKIIDACMMNGLESILKLGCYIILFSMLARLLMKVPCPNAYLSYAGVGFMEITNGISHIASVSSIPIWQKYLFIMAFAAFGGLSGAAQTESMILDSGLSTSNYIKAKLLTAVLVISLAFLFILLNDSVPFHLMPELIHCGY